MTEDEVSGETKSASALNSAFSPGLSQRQVDRLWRVLRSQRNGSSHEKLPRHQDAGGAESTHAQH